MRYFFWIILVFVLTSCDLAAQNVRFSIGVGIGSVSNYLGERDEIFEGTSYLPVSDSMLEVSEVKQAMHITTEYKSKMQFSIFGTVDFRLGRKMELSSGLELSRFAFNSTYRSTGKVLTKVVTDTIPITDLYVFHQNPECDSSVYLPLGGNQGQPEFSLVDLRIPLKLKYELFDGFKVNVGGVLVTPIYSGQKGTKTVTNKHVEGDKTICVSTYESYRDHTGKGFRQMRWSLLGGVSYDINPKLELSLLMEKSMQGVFISPSGNFAKDPFKPVSTRIGLSYYFSASKKIKQSAN